MKKNSYQNKKRKRNLAKKRSKKLYLRLCYSKWLVSIKLKPLQQIMFEEMLIFGTNISVEDCINMAVQQGKISLSESIILKDKLKGSL